jgi:hypothetical protein
MTGLDGRTRRDRARYYAGGHVTVGTISTFVKKHRSFQDWYVGKLRGVIVGHPKTRRWKFRDQSAARAAAAAFKRFSVEVAEGKSEAGQ